MTTPGRYETHVAFYRALADRIVALAVADEKFRQQLRSDPVKTLIDEGFPRGISHDISRELFGADVRSGGPCGRASCWLSCVWTCKTATNPT